jgi:uncharacterized protein (TIGR03437 family)
VPSQFAGLTSGFVGLFQVNAQIPLGLPLGNLPKLGIQIEFTDGRRSNLVDIAVEP